MAPTRRDDHSRGHQPRRHTSPGDLRRGHDATYRLLHQHPEPVRELLAGHCGAWIDVGGLDFARMERLPEGHVSDEGERRSGDVAWRVGYLREGRHLVVLVEFQSTPHARMARRMHEYGALTATGLDRADRLDEGDLQPYGLAVVVYTGPRPWRPRGSVGIGERPREGAATLARQSRWSPFCFVDIRELGRQESGTETLLTWLGRAEADGGAARRVCGGCGSGCWSATPTPGTRSCGSTCSCGWGSSPLGWAWTRPWWRPCGDWRREKC